MTDPWEALAGSAATDPPLRRLFDIEPDRVRGLTFEACGLALDLSKQPWSQASFARADLSHANFSHGIINHAIMTDAVTEKTKLHGVADVGVAWTKRQLAAAVPTDQDLYEAETWQPPP